MNEVKIGALVVDSDCSIRRVVSVTRRDGRIVLGLQNFSMATEDYTGSVIYRSREAGEAVVVA